MSSGRVSQHVQRSAATDCPSESTLGRDQNAPAVFVGSMVRSTPRTLTAPTEAMSEEGSVIC